MALKGKVDIKKLKTALTLEMYENIFKELNIPIFSKNSKSWILYTACHNKDPYNGSPKLYFYLDTKIFTCYTSCNSSMDIVGLVQKRLKLLNKDCSFYDAVDNILSISGLEKKSILRINNSKHTYKWEEDFNKFIRFRNNMTELPEYNQNIVNTFKKSYPTEWLEEGISIESLNKYKIGYYERLSQTTIPCFDKEGRLVGIRIRNWNIELLNNAKYMPLITLDGTCYKFDTNKIFYGENYNWLEIERTKKCFIGESEKFVLKMDTWFNDKSTALGMFGGNLGLYRRNQLIKAGVEKIIYVPDNDYREDNNEEFKNWENKLYKFTELFKGFAQVEVVWDKEGLLGYKDNATDKDFETWESLYECRDIIIK